MTRLNFLTGTFEGFGKCPFCNETLALRVKGNILKFLVGVRIYQKGYESHVEICMKTSALEAVNRAIEKSNNINSQFEKENCHE
ncbi:MAG TPA: hypothetical protein VJ044_09285 [Candidatus Hodarchaeales archaeon]|nr:hypothetical protein [Candidatus Hodarchaeales archaeon]